MNNLRMYGNAPYGVVLVHGGPGASGEMAPVARKLSSTYGYGVIEPLQTKDSVRKQVEELRTAIEENGSIPVILIGWSWGAWLSYILAASHPFLVKKLILVSSGPFEKKYVDQIMETRLNRMNQKQKDELQNLINHLADSETENKQELFERFGKLFDKVDSFSPTEHDSETIEFSPNIYNKVWSEAAELRESGKILTMAKRIQCPIVAIHGDYDPHPAEGIIEPLSKNIKNFKFILIEHCGHKPWAEKEAETEFYNILNKELKN